MKTNSVSPVFQVFDLERALSFYCNILGFAKEFVYGEPAFYAGVKMDAIVLHLNASAENERRRGLGSVYVFCDQVDDYYHGIREKGAEITTPLNSYPYGMRDFQTRDPDGNLITFGCPTVDAEKD